MEHGIATHMNYTCKIYSMTSENGMSYCVCQIHVLGVQCMVVISTTNCNVVLAHTLFLFLAPEMQHSEKQNEHFEEAVRQLSECHKVHTV